ncbi:unnamed protein product [Dicrocoelium dendriticum]|nr:unnamed protein product [Dicrocoelium dendriticum]
MGWSSVHGIGENLINLGLFLCMVVAITFFVCIFLMFIATALRHSRVSVSELTTSGQPTVGSTERRPPAYGRTKLMRQLKYMQTQIQSSVEYGRTKLDENQYATLPLGVTVNSDSVLFTVNSV